MEDPCLPPLDWECGVLYEPTWENLWGATGSSVESRCANSQACHGQGGGISGLELHEPGLAFDNLQPFIEPGNPECSELIRRLESTDPAFVMPPGGPESASFRCGFIRWIADGALEE